MATITSTPSAPSLSISGNTTRMGNITWSIPSLPSNSTITSCVLTGVAMANMSMGSCTIKVNNQTVSSGSSFTVNLGTSNNTTSIPVSAVGRNTYSRGTVTFSNLLYTVTYEIASGTNQTPNIYLGTNQIQNIYLGNTNITHVYIGNVLVYQITDGDNDNDGDNGNDNSYGNLIYSAYDSTGDIDTGIDMFEPRKAYTILFNAKEQSADFTLALAFFTKLVYINREKKLDLQLSCLEIGPMSKGKVSFNFNKDYVFIFSPVENSPNHWKCTLLEENVSVFEDNLQLFDNIDFNFKATGGSFNKLEIYEEISN